MLTQDRHSLKQLWIPRCARVGAAGACDRFDEALRTVRSPNPMNFEGADAMHLDHIALRDGEVMHALRHHESHHHFLVVFW